MSNQAKKLEIMISAWNKICYCRDTHNTEISGWLISSSQDNLFECNDFITTKQTVTAASIEFDDEDLARFSFEMIQKGILPCMCQKIWLHTHPGNSCQPSGTDETTFEEMLSKIANGDFLIMMIVAMNDETYIRLSVKTEFGIFSKMMTHEVVYELNNGWDEEFKQNILKRTYPTYSGQRNRYDLATGSYQNADRNKSYNQSNYINPNYYRGNPNTSMLPSHYQGTPKSESTIGSYWELAKILHAFDVDIVDELDADELRQLCSSYKTNIHELQNMEQKLNTEEETWIARDYKKVLESYNIISVHELSEEDWMKVIEETSVRKFKFEKYEDENTTFGGEKLEKIALTDNDLFGDDDYDYLTR